MFLPSRASDGKNEIEDETSARESENNVSLNAFNSPLAQRATLFCGEFL
jgi:hypothetical protein